MWRNEVGDQLFGIEISGECASLVKRTVNAKRKAITRLVHRRIICNILWQQWVPELMNRYVHILMHSVHGMVTSGRARRRSSSRSALIHFSPMHYLPPLKLLVIRSKCSIQMSTKGSA